jgi:hypothetical protein
MPPASYSEGAGFDSSLRRWPIWWVIVAFSCYATNMLELKIKAGSFHIPNNSSSGITVPTSLPASHRGGPGSVHVVYLLDSVAQVKTFFRLRQCLSRQYQYRNTIQLYFFTRRRPHVVSAFKNAVNKTILCLSHSMLCSWESAVK